jgi:hypothetical protein
VPSLTPTQRRLRAQVAANTRWAMAPEGDRRATGRRGQAGLLSRFAREIDPDGTLPPEELAKRVENARQAHMARLALASSRARKKGGAGDARTA